MKKPQLSTVEGWASIVLNGGLFAAKLLAGLATGSVAIIADAWHTLSDSLTSIVVLIGARFVAKPADAEHPFGHGRAELIASVAIGVMLGFAGINFIIDGIEKVMHPQIVHYNTFAIVIISLSVVLKEVMAQFAFWAYRKSGSGSLKADGWHHRSDAITSALLLVGIFAVRYLPWLDAVLGMLIAVLIIVTAIAIIRDGVSPLMGEQPSQELLEQVQRIIAEVHADPTTSHHFHLHNYGKHQELTFHMEFDGQLSIDEGHRIISSIEERISAQLGIDATIHLEPQDDDNT